jgi:lipoprotein-anchoring transpeptidase ErfK/SrfK
VVVVLFWTTGAEVLSVGLLELYQTKAPTAAITSITTAAIVPVLLSLDCFTSTGRASAVRPRFESMFVTIVSFCLRLLRGLDWCQSKPYAENARRRCKFHNDPVIMALKPKPACGAQLSAISLRSPPMNNSLKQAALISCIVSAFLLPGTALSQTYTVMPDGLYGDVVVAKKAGKRIAAASIQKTSLAAGTIRRGQVITYRSGMPKGSIEIDTASNRLYLVIGDRLAAAYDVATAREGFGWSGKEIVSGKVVWPDWAPPAPMRARKPELPARMAGGPDNPLGSRAIYLGSSLYRIHGTNEPQSIGNAVSSGCIRMLNADVEELYRLVKVGAQVRVF